MAAYSLAIILVLTIAAIFRLTDAIEIVTAPKGKWISGDIVNRTMWQKACDFPKLNGLITIRTDSRKINSLASCAALCWATSTCTHFVYINNTTCHSGSWNPRWNSNLLQPIEITNPDLAKFYICGYVPSRRTTVSLNTQKCKITTSPARVVLPMGDSNLPKYWVSLISNLVNMTLPLHLFGIPNVAILKLGEPYHQSMKCLIGQEKIAQEIVSILKICFNTYNKTDCNNITPFRQSYSVDTCISEKIIIPSRRGVVDMRILVQKWIRSTNLPSLQKSKTKKDLRTCLRRRMSTSPVLIDQTIRDPLMNKALIKSFISQAMKGEYSYYYGPAINVEKYFFGLKRMLCLVQSLLKNHCNEERLKETLKKNKSHTA